MARDFVYFDLETQKSANDVGGWGRKDLMKMSIGVTYSTRLGAYRIFGEEDADDLVDQLRRADLVIGFNHIYFDYEVLQAYTVLNLKEEIPSFDLMVDLEEKIGHRPKLEAVAQPTLGVGKPPKAPRRSAGGVKARSWKSPATAPSTSRSPRKCTNTVPSMAWSVIRTASSSCRKWPSNGPFHKKPPSHERVRPSPVQGS